MREFYRIYTTRQLVAVALAGGLALSVHLVGSGGVAARAQIAGQARVVDGDTIEVAGHRVRLEGIDAPETAQRCAASPATTWECGAAATAHLVRLIGDHKVQCDSVGTDRYGRTLGVCRAGDLELNAEMVRQGLAWAFVKYSRRYERVEAEARGAGLGVWRHATEPAWVFRAQRWASAEGAAPGGCAIKGNITRNGSIYHVPWSPWYDKVKVETDKGERWFCSEAEAEAAGWRAAQVR